LALFCCSQEQCVVNVCQPGKDLKSAGYALYSSSTILVITIGEGVYGFTLDPMIGEYILTHPDVKIPEVRTACFGLLLALYGGGSSRLYLFYLLLSDWQDLLVQRG
jgi:hypothetical protein